MEAKARYCEICKLPIEPDRVEAVPESRLCTEHAAAIRKFGGEFIVSAETEVTSKQGSLKRNYGSVTTKKTRNTEAVEKLRDEFQQSR